MSAFTVKADTTTPLMDIGDVGGEMARWPIGGWLRGGVGKWQGNELLVCIASPPTPCAN